jgi:3-deoxy-D-manno-octulosonic-acid transferase
VSAAWTAYRLVAPALGAIAPAARFLASPHERILWGERMGGVVVRGGCHAWIHAASLGEATAVAALVEGLRRVAPSCRLHLTATTRTGRARLEPLGASVSLAPLDAPQAVRRFFAGTEPRRLFLVETELWPHWLLRARRERVPVAVVSARLSERSVGRYARFGPGLRSLVGGLAAVLCQTDADARRWLAIGAAPERVEVVGNLKDDALPEPSTDRALARRLHDLDPARPLLVCGSIRPGEARILARAWARTPRPIRETWQVVAVPRHPSASDELRAEAARAGQRLIDDGIPEDGAWRWDDRTGVLRGWYEAADVAVVGGTMGPFGGHNPLEPAAAGAAVVVGPEHAAQRDAVEALRARGAIVIADGETALAESLTSLLGDAARRESLARDALAVVRARRGAVLRTVRELAARDLWPVT